MNRRLGGRTAINGQLDISIFTFTGSPKTGKLIREQAGIRNVALELGRIEDDRSPRCRYLQAAKLVAQKSFNNAGQVLYICPKKLMSKKKCWMYF